MTVDAAHVVNTIGHSTRSLLELVEILNAYAVTFLVDIRKMPRSRKNPHFNSDVLPTALEEHGITYAHMPGLAGLRKPAGSSINAAWRNASVRAFADYMQTAEFAASIEQLVAESSRRATAIMCAEAVPWRCHRSLVADALTARGISVQHLMSATKASRHIPPDFARIDGTRVTYPLVA